MRVIAFAHYETQTYLSKPPSRFPTATQELLPYSTHSQAQLRFVQQSFVEPNRL